MTRGDHLNGTHWQQFARECGLNPKQVINRVDALAKSAIAEAKLAATEVAAMPAGDHEVLDQARQAVESRARQLLTQLQEFDDKPAIKVAYEEAGHTKSGALVPQIQ